MAASRTGLRRSDEKDAENAGVDDSSDSESEPEQAKIFHRRISTNKDIRTTVGWPEILLTYVSQSLRVELSQVENDSHITFLCLCLLPYFF